jgi:TPR repeat protein
MAPTRSAPRDDAEGQYLLGRAHERGVGVSKNVREAARHYRLAAAQGYAGAHCHLPVNCRLAPRGPPALRPPVLVGLAASEIRSDTHIIICFAGEFGGLPGAKCQCV